MFTQDDNNQVCLWFIFVRSSTFFRTEASGIWRHFHLCTLVI